MRVAAGLAIAAIAAAGAAALGDSVAADGRGSAAVARNLTRQLCERMGCARPLAVGGEANVGSGAAQRSAAARQQEPVLEWPPSSWAFRGGGGAPFGLNANRTRYHPAASLREGAPFSGGVGVESRVAPVADDPTVLHQFAFSSDGRSFAVDAYLHDAGLGEIGESGGGGAGAGQEGAVQSEFIDRSILEARGRARRGSGGGVIAIVLASDRREEVPSPVPLVCKFTADGVREDAQTLVVHAPAELRLFGSIYAPPWNATFKDFRAMHAYTILCPVPADFVRVAMGPAPPSGEEGGIVAGVQVSLVYNVRAEGGVADVWMPPLDFRDMRVPPPSTSMPESQESAPPHEPEISLAMCLGGVFGVGGGRYLPEYIEYHRALGVERFEFFDMGSTGATAKILEGYARSGILRLHNWATLPGVDFLATMYEGDAYPTTQRMGWNNLTHYAQGQTLTRQICYWTLRRRARYVIFNDIDEVLAVWRPPHTFQQVLMPWMEEVHNRTSEVVGFSLKNKVAPPNLVGEGQLYDGHTTALHTDGGDDHDEGGALGHSLLYRADYESERQNDGSEYARLRYVYGRWKYVLRTLEEDGIALQGTIWYHSIYNSVVVQGHVDDRATKQWWKVSVPVQSVDRVISPRAPAAQRAFKLSASRFDCSCRSSLGLDVAASSRSLAWEVRVADTESQLQLNDQLMRLVPEDMSYLRHLVPYPRLTNGKQRRKPFPSRGYARKPLPKAPLVTSLKAIRSGPDWLRAAYFHSPSSLRASDLARAGSGRGELPGFCRPTTHNYTYLCA